MINLIKNELTKIFKKKSIYITFILIFIFMLIINIVSIYTKNVLNGLEVTMSNQEEVQKEIENTDKNDPANIEYFAQVKAKTKVKEMKEKYGKDSWQSVILDKKIIKQITDLEIAKSERNEEKTQILEKEYQESIEKLNNEDWKYFAEKELIEVTQKVKEEKEQLEKTQKKNIEKNLQELEIQKQVAKWRIEKEIKYGKDYLNNALVKYETANKELENLKETQSQEFIVKQQIQQYEKEIAEFKYSIENKQEIGRTDNTRGMIMNFFETYGIFIVIIVIMIAGSIVSDEFNRGTIKLLLVRPYKRSKILISKFIAILLLIVITILAMTVVQMIIGGILFGFDSLQMPVTTYNFETKAIETMNVFQYFGIQALCNLPMYIILGTLAFTISVVLCNTPIAIVMPLLVYMMSSVINQLIIRYNIQWLGNFVTLNWNLSGYIGGGLGPMEGLTIGISSIICIVYFVIMMGISLIAFKKKNIKNI